MLALNDRFVSTVFERREFDKLGEFFSEDIVLTSDSERIDGIDGYVEMMEGTIDAFSDLDVEILDSFVDGDSLIVRSRYSGTHTGEFEGVPATDTSVSWESMSVSRVADGKFVEINTIQDRANLLTQLGVLDERAA
jgi:hypothetical protein